jgi:hypothetical protein
MEKIKMYVPLSEWDLRVLKDDEYYREVYEKDFEKVLASVTFVEQSQSYNILVQLCFGSLDGNAWIDTTFWKKKGPIYIEVVTGEPLHEEGFLEIEYDNMCIAITIGDVDG